MIYVTQFQGHCKGLCSRNIRKIVLNYVIINTLHVGIYMIELFSKAAIPSIHVIFFFTYIGCSMVAVRYVIHELTKCEHCIASIQKKKFSLNSFYIERYQR